MRCAKKFDWDAQREFNEIRKTVYWDVQRWLIEMCQKGLMKCTIGGLLRCAKMFDGDVQKGFNEMHKGGLMKCTKGFFEMCKEVW